MAGMSEQAHVCVSICVSYLFQEYGGLENAPEEIKATIVEMEQLTMSEVKLYRNTAVVYMYMCMY